MALFDQIFGASGSRPASLNAREAFASVMLVAVAADGEISDEEAEAFIGFTNRMTLFKSQSGADFNEMIRKLQNLLKKQGFRALLEKAAPSIPDHLKDTAFAVAADLLFADGSIADEEKEVLAVIQNTMGVSDDSARKIVDVLLIKNRGEIQQPMTPVDRTFCTGCGAALAAGTSFCSGCGQRVS